MNGLIDMTFFLSLYPGWKQIQFQKHNIQKSQTTKFKIIVMIIVIYIVCIIWCRLGSSVDIETDNELDGPGLNPGWDKIFHLSRPALGPIQPPVKWVPGLSQG